MFFVVVVFLAEKNKDFVFVAEYKQSVQRYICVFSLLISPGLFGNSSFYSTVQCTYLESTANIR